MELKKGYTFLGIAVLLWSYQPTLMGSLLESLPMVLIVFLRVIVATFALFLIKLFSKKDDEDIYKPKLIIDSIVLALVLFITTFLLCLGLGNNSTQLSRFFSEGMAPIFAIMLASLIFKEERTGFFNIVGSIIVVLAIMGVYLVTTYDFSLPTTYDYHLIFVFVAALLWAVYLIYYRRQEENLSNKDTFLIVGSILSVLYLAVSIRGNYLESFKELNGTLIFTIVMLSLIVDVGCIFTFYKGVGILGCNRSNIVIMLCPLLTTVTLSMILNQPVHYLQWIGCGLIFVANVTMVSKDLIEEEQRIYY